MRTGFTSVVIVGLAILVTACEPPELPGRSLGTYEVRGTLLANTCGTGAVPAYTEILFDSELRLDTSTPYWRRAGSPPMVGSMNHDGTMRFSFRQSFTMDEDPAGSGARCTLTQVETLEVGVSVETDEEGLEVESLSGTNDVMWSASPGTSCSYITAGSGGPFLALPCGISYELSGTQEVPADPIPDGGMN